MTGKILFVHGTGVRAAGYERSIAIVADKVLKYLPRYEVVGCHWGDAFGARLNAHGQSIPGYADNGAASDAIEAAEMARWTLLTEDPLLELRIMDIPQPIGLPQGPAVWVRLKAAAEAESPIELLETWGLTAIWPTFIRNLVADKNWDKTIQGMGGTQAQLSAPVSRAVTAAFLKLLRCLDLPGITGKQRDQLVSELVKILGNCGLGIGDWFLGKLTNFAVPRRGALADASGAPIGDIIRYQSRGELLRNFIGECVGKTGASVILAHSLGGVAAVDWLASGVRDIKALVTVGSQAPFFYEIDALASRAYGTGLPEFFPRRWINFYDKRDFLSFSGQQLFRDFAHDVEVDNGQPFPESHSAYWHNDEVWSEIARFLP